MSLFSMHTVSYKPVHTMGTYIYCYRMHVVLATLIHAAMRQSRSYFDQRQQ